MTAYDLLVKNGSLIVPGVGPIKGDLAVKDGRIASIGDEIASSQAADVIDAAGKVVMPGAVDAHFHLGIYR